jgi:hypothetical protein
MSISIYYEARRAQPLTAAEQAAANGVAERYSVDDQIEKHMATGEGLNWESFDLNLNPAPGVILSGATKLPDISDEASFQGVEHWCACLAELRRAVQSAEWSVVVEDAPLHWDANRQIYDLTN